MKLELSMEIKQAQKLHLTQELRQSIELLQMNSYELEQHITEAIQENPIIEANYTNEVDWLKFAEKINTKIISSPRYNSEDDEPNPENYLASLPNLHDHLEEEVGVLRLSKAERRIAEYIIQRIDLNGYFLVDKKTAAKENNCTEKELEEVLEKVQTIEPKGLAATSLVQCLVLQLKEEDPQEQITRSIIENDLELVATKKYTELQKKHGLSKEELARHIEKIKSLDPKPGKKFSEFVPSYVYPDIIVEKTPSGFEIIDNSPIPELHINSYYQKLLRESKDPEVIEYIKERLNKALNLIKNIEQRKTTIHKVASNILQYQQAFFDENENLRPMKLKDIAQSTGFHESTISRTVNNKYMLTPKGVFELRHFFETGIMDESGEEIGVSKIKQEILEMIQKENKHKPLSDQKICEELARKGMPISRRTVAKYRDEMKILGSSQRKEI